MTESEFGAHRRLERLQDSLARQVGSSGRGLRDIEHLPVTAELLTDVEICLRARHGIAIGTGLYVLQGLLLARDSDELPAPFRRFLVVRVEELLDHPTQSVARRAIDWFVTLRASYPHFRQRMLRVLASADAGVRKIALRYYETYARPNEVKPLLCFRIDEAARQLRPDGEWRYELRDRALERIEEQLGLRFERVVRTEAYRGNQVTWYDWPPVRDWWSAGTPARQRTTDRPLDIPADSLSGIRAGREGEKPLPGPIYKSGRRSLRREG